MISMPLRCLKKTILHTPSSAESLPEIQHGQKMENKDGPIVAAYATVLYKDGREDLHSDDVGANQAVMEAIADKACQRRRDNQPRLDATNIQKRWRRKQSCGVLASQLSGH